MYKVSIKAGCSCFYNSGLNEFYEFDDENTAYKFAIDLNHKMNNTFCSKHSFEVLKIFDNYNITFSKSIDKALKCCGSGCCK